MTDSQDFAEEVKLFFNKRVSLIKELKKNYLYDSFVIALSALDGLSDLWNQLDNNSSQQGNKKKYIKFLMRVDSNSEKGLSNVCTPFLIYFLKKQNIEYNFINKLEEAYLSYCATSNNIDWGEEGNPMNRRSHFPSDDGTIDKIKNIYNSCQTDNQQFGIIQDIYQTLFEFTYAGLIYKIYRCPFIHTYRRSQYSQFAFNQGMDIKVKHYINPPQLDIGIHFLIELIKQGANLVHDLIIEKNYVYEDIEYDDQETITIKTRKS